MISTDILYAHRQSMRNGSQREEGLCLDPKLVQHGLGQSRSQAGN